MTATPSSRAFDRGTARAEKAANGPVFITDRGRPTHGLLGIEKYRRLTGDGTIADLLAMPDFVEAELGLPARTERSRPIDLG